MRPELSQLPTITPSFYGYDGGGSVRALTNAAGAVTDTYEYDGFGNEISSTGSTPNSYLYRGEYFDSDLGLYYLRARYYNPLTGRFMSKDPEDHSPTAPNELHKYLYTGGDPVNAVDPSGRGELVENLIQVGVLIVTIGLPVYKYGQCVEAIFKEEIAYLYWTFKNQPVDQPRWSCYTESWWGMGSPYPLPSQ